MANVVFRGTITAVRDAGTGKIAVFRVARVWKGHVGRTIEVAAPGELEPCAGPEDAYFKVGNELLVYANGTASPFGLSTCSRTRLAKNAKSDLDELDAEESKPLRRLNSK